jgi:eukaryotic-like serine/threonine-protein kinase
LEGGRLAVILDFTATAWNFITRTDLRLEPPFAFADRLLTKLHSDATPELEDVIMKALEFESDKRYSSCAEMKEALEAIILSS